MRSSGLGSLAVWLHGIAMLAAMSHASFAAADIPPGPELLEAESALSMEFETPHTKWAKPYAQGTTRALFFAPFYQGGTEGREIIELMQRFDLEADAVFCFPGGNRLIGDLDPRWYQDPDLGTKRLLRLLETPYDVIVMNQIPPANLNETAKAAVLAAVEQGAGLVYVGEEESWGADIFTPSGEALPGIWKKSVYTHGKGRVIHLGSRPPLAYGLGWEMAFDYQMAGQGKALLWAANQSPQGELSLLTPNAGDTIGGSLESTAGPAPANSVVTLQWSAGPAGSTIHVNLRKPSGQAERLITVDASQAGQIPVPIPDLRAGTYYFDAFLRSERGIENWTSTNWTFETAETLGDLVLKRDWAELGEEILGTVQLVGPKATDRVVMRVFDGAERLLSEQPAEVDASGAASFALKVADWFPMLVRVEAVRLQGEKDVSASHTYVRITHRKQDQFHFILWNAHSTDLAPYGALSMAKYGVTSVLQNNPLPALSAANLAFVPYASSFRASSHSLLGMLDENGVLKSGCVHDEAAMDKFVSDTVARAQGAREMGTFVYSLGDENAVRGGCLSPHCKVAYQNYLRDEVYGTIEALNASWNNSFSSFEEVDVDREGELPAADAPQWFREFYQQRLVKNQTDDHVTSPEQIVMGDINDEMRALQDENFARWYDRQDFQNWTYVQWCKRFVKAFREIDPHALTGFEGTDSFSIRKLTTRSRQGGDIDLFIREMDYFGPYNDPASEVVRSLAKGNFPRGNWFGYSMDPDKELGYYWEQITNGFNAIQWWRLDNLGQGYHGYIGPDFAPTPTSRPLIEDTQIVREGLGDLLMHYEMQGDGIAMLYSLPSTYIAHFDGNDSYGLYTRDHEYWIQAIHDAGLQFDYVTDRQLRLGEFDASKYKVLILPLAFAMGDKEAEVIRAFVEGGGTLVADVRPGLYTDRCKRRESGALDEVFGIKRTGWQNAVNLDRMDITGTLHDTELRMQWGNWFGKDIYPQMTADPSVELTTGEATGWNYPIHFHHGLRYPAGIVNRFGKGTSYLFNFSVYNAPFDALLKQLLAASGIAPSITVRGTTGELAERQLTGGTNEDGTQIPAALVASADGAHPKGLEVTRWRSGDVQLVALLGDADRDVQVTLPEAQHVYDIKTRAYVGLTDQFSVDLKKSRASFYALSRQACMAPGLSLTPDSSGRVAQVLVQTTDLAGSRAVKLRLSDPSGRDVAWMTDHVIVAGSGGIVNVPFSLDDPVGEWRLVAEDLFSGLESSIAIDVE